MDGGDPRARLGNEKKMVVGGKRTLRLVLLTFILAIALVAYMWPIRTTYWWDETVYLLNAKNLLHAKSAYDELAYRPPVLPIILALSSCLSDNPYNPGIVVSFLALLLPLSVYLVGKEIYDAKTGIVAMLITAFNPAIAQNAHYVMTDVLSIGLSVFAFYLLLNNEKRMASISSGAFLALAVLTRFTSLILIPVFLSYTYLAAKQGKPKKVLEHLCGFGIVFLPYLVWAQMTQGFFLEPFIEASRNGAVDLNEPALYFLDKIPGMLTYIILFGIGLQILFFGPMQKDRSQNRTVTEAALLSWAALVFLQVTITPHKEPRYLLPIVAPLALLSSRGIAYVMENKKLVILAVLVAGLIYFQSAAPAFTRLQEPFINKDKTDEMKISEYIRSNYPQDITVYTNNNYPVYAYYSNRKTLNPEGLGRPFSYYSESLKEKDLLIVYKENWQWASSILNGSKDFRKVTELNLIEVYEYDPSGKSGKA